MGNTFEREDQSGEHAMWDPKTGLGDMRDRVMRRINRIDLTTTDAAQSLLLVHHGGAVEETDENIHPDPLGDAIAQLGGVGVAAEAIEDYARTHPESDLGSMIVIEKLDPGN